MNPKSGFYLFYGNIKLLKYHIKIMTKDTIQVCHLVNIPTATISARDPHPHFSFTILASFGPDCINGSQAEGGLFRYLQRFFFNLTDGCETLFKYVIQFLFFFHSAYENMIYLTQLAVSVRLNLLILELFSVKYMTGFVTNHWEYNSQLDSYDPFLQEAYYPGVKDMLNIRFMDIFQVVFHQGLLVEVPKQRL